MTERKAMITGIGCVTPIGTGVSAFWEGIRSGASAVRKIESFDVSGFRTQIAAQVPGFDPLTFMDRRKAQRLDRFSQFAVAAAKLALTDAGLPVDAVDKNKAGVYLGSALGGFKFAEEEAYRFASAGPRGISPMLALSVFSGAASCNVAMEFGFNGPNETNGMSCAAGAVAIGNALRAVRRGEVDVVLAGGTDAPMAPLCFGAFAAIRAMSTRNDTPQTACRPFDRHRDGFVLGEGAAVLLIESEERARRRGARIYGELAGYGTTSDAHHATAPLPGGGQSSRCIQQALDDAGLPTDCVGYINAHASSTPLNDVAEAKAIRTVFGDLAVPVSGTKSLYGHPLGAAGALEAAITCLALHHGWLPPTVNLTEVDPDVDLDLISGAGRFSSANAAISNSFGFGGINACLAFRAVRSP